MAAFMSALTFENIDQRQRWTVSVGFALLLHGAILAVLIYGYERFGSGSTSSTVMIDLAPAGGGGLSSSVEALPPSASLPVENKDINGQASLLSKAAGSAIGPGIVERSAPVGQFGGNEVPDSVRAPGGEEAAKSAGGGAGIARSIAPATPSAPPGLAAPAGRAPASRWEPIENSITVVTPYGWRPGKPGHPGAVGFGHPGAGGIGAGGIGGVGVGVGSGGGGRSISLLRRSRGLAGRPPQQSTQRALQRQQAAPGNVVNSVGAHVEDRVRAAMARAGAAGEILRNVIGGATAVPGGGGARGAGAAVMNAIGQAVPARGQAGAGRPASSAISAAVAGRIVAINGTTFGRVAARPGAIGGPHRSGAGVIDGTTFHPRH